MARLNVVTEGQSEESFVRVVLAPYLGRFDIFAVARSVETSRKHATIVRGGLKTYEKAKRDIVRWLTQDKSAYVSTLFDLYGLPADFPVLAASGAAGPRDRVRELEETFRQAINNPRFIPYIQLHEFEGLLFSDINAIDSELALIDKQSQLQKLAAIRADVASPELIDDGYDTCPSRRLA